MRFLELQRPAKLDVNCIMVISKKKFLNVPREVQRLMYINHQTISKLE